MAHVCHCQWKLYVSIFDKNLNIIIIPTCNSSSKLYSSLQCYIEFANGGCSTARAVVKRLTKLATETCPPGKSRFLVFALHIQHVENIEVILFSCLSCNGQIYELKVKQVFIQYILNRSK